MYLQTLKEAEDPEIIITQSDSLPSIKNFPITKVKYR